MRFSMAANDFNGSLVFCGRIIFLFKFSYGILSLEFSAGKAFINAKAKA